MPSESQQRPPPRRPLQFGIGTMLMLAVVVSVIFGALRWMGATPAAALIVLLILAVAVPAAVALVVVIGRMDRDDEA